MLSRALSLAAVTLLIGCLTAVAVRAVENLEAGKSPAQIFAGTCNACHKSPRGLLRSVPPSSLPGFLRQHYTTSSDMASVLASYLVANGATDTRAQPKEAKQGKGAGLAIVFGNILDTIPGCLVIGAKFAGFESLSFTLILGIFLGGIPEAAASATMLRKAGYSDRTIFLLWSAVLAAGVVAAVAGKLFINGSESTASVLAQAVAGGAILALVTHAMIPEALHKGGSTVVLPAVAGFLFALYLALLETGWT